MKLGKLLAAGKSIMNGRRDISYRSSKQIYLPKFGSAKNPFTSEAPVQTDGGTPSPAPEATTEPSASANGPVDGSDRLARGTAPAGNAAFGRNSDTHSRTVNMADATCVSSENSPAISGAVVPSSKSKGPAGTTEMPRFTAAAANSELTNPQSATRAVPHSPAKASLQSQTAHAGPKRSEAGSTIQRVNALLRSAFGKASPSDKSAKNQKGTATQTELSLDSVKVVHNDLSDVDVEVVPIKSRSGAPELPAPRKSWEYVGERLFGVEAS